MEFLNDNLIVTVTAILSGLFCGLLVWRFLRLSRDEQIEAVRVWLLIAVTDAERELGSGTGRLKLRYVYDLFVVRFPWIAKAISFALFSDMVDDALGEMRELLAKNTAVRKYVEEQE